MSWTVHVIDNTITVDESAQVSLEALPVHGDMFADGYGGVSRGKLLFDDDAMEHIDYLCNPEIRDVLIAHGASGRVTFGALEGDNSGSFWGYEFSPGNCQLLKGTLVWGAK